MKLCEHIAPLYQHEIKKGNEPLFVSIPDPHDRYARIRLGVFFKFPLQQYESSTIEEQRFIDPHYPSERYYLCNLCGCMLSGPLEKDQKRGGTNDQPLTFRAKRWLLPKKTYMQRMAFTENLLFQLINGNKEKLTKI